MKRTALVAADPSAPPAPSGRPVTGRDRAIATVTTLPTPPEPPPEPRPEPARPRAAVIPVASTQEALAFDPEATDPRPQLRLVTGDETELDRFAARFAQVVVEVIGGDRAVHQLMRWTSVDVYADMLRRSHALQRTTPAQHRVRRLRAQVRSVHLSRPQPEAAEISIHVRHGARSRAIAARIECIEGRWRCTVLQFG